MSEYRIHVLACDADGCEELISSENVYALYPSARAGGWWLGDPLQNKRCKHFCGLHGPELSVFAVESQVK